MAVGIINGNKRQLAVRFPPDVMRDVSASAALTNNSASAEVVELVRIALALQETKGDVLPWRLRVNVALSKRAFEDAMRDHKSSPTHTPAARAQVQA